MIKRTLGMGVVAAFAFAVAASASTDASGPALQYASVVFGEGGYSEASATGEQPAFLQETNCYSLTNDNTQGANAALVNDAVAILRATQTGEYLYQNGYLNITAGAEAPAFSVCLSEELNDTNYGAIYHPATNRFITRTNISAPRLASSLGHELGHRARVHFGRIGSVQSMTPNDAIFIVMTMEADAHSLQAALDDEIMRAGHELYSDAEINDQTSNVIALQNLRAYYEVAPRGQSWDAERAQRGMERVFDRMVNDIGRQRDYRERVISSFCRVYPQGSSQWVARDIPRELFLAEAVGGSPFTEKNFAAGRLDVNDFIFDTRGSERRLCFGAGRSFGGD